MKKRLFTALCLVGLAGVISFSACNPRKGYQPDQPIAFDHTLHAGKTEIPCEYCHVNVNEGPKASVPSINTCMNCHSQVRASKPEVKKIREAWQNGTPVQWVKVYNLPILAKFSHSPHISRGFACTECHGTVEEMVQIRTNNQFNMGWCINCHRQPPLEGTKGPVDCDSCHY